MYRILNILLFAVLTCNAAAVPSDSLKLSFGTGRGEFTLTVRNGTVEGNLEIGGIMLRRTLLDSLEFIRVSANEYFHAGLPGSPELPVRSRLFEKDPRADYTLLTEITDSVLIDLDMHFPGIPLFPAQPPVRKSAIAKHMLSGKNDRLYREDRWIGLPVVQLHDEGTMRGLHLGRITFAPLQYNPVRNQLKIYTGISFRCEPGEAATHVTKIRSMPFNRALSGVARNSTSAKEEKVLSAQPVTMVILSDTVFRESLARLVRWKTEKGYRVIEAYTTDPGVGTDAPGIRTYLEELYKAPPPDTAPPTYLLIVGDVEHVPPSTVLFPVTDLYYTTFDGPGDYLPEMFCGRLPAKTVADLEAMMDKIIGYERYQFPDPAFLDKSILIAGNDARGYVEGNGQLNYGTTYYFNASNGIDTSVYLHPGASSLDSEIREEFSSGAGFVNYTGHGITSGWVDPSFKKSHLASLGNRDKYPLVIGNGCETNIFNLSTDCFAESIVKIPDRGALAYIGCTADSYWVEDFYWAVGVGPISANPTFEETGPGMYDRLFHLNGEPVDTWTPSIGEMIFAGNMAVQASTSSYKEYYWRIYQLMGDPSLVPWFTIPGEHPVDFPASLPPSADMLSLDLLPYDYAAISSEGVLVDARHAGQDGQVDLTIPEPFRGDPLLLVITGDYRKPFIRQIPDIGHFELLDYALVNEETGDGKLTNGETAGLTIRMVNTSTVISAPDTLRLRELSGHLQLSDSTVFLPPTEPGDTLTLASCCGFRVNEAVADKAEAGIQLSRDLDITGNTQTITLQLAAPSLVLKSFSASDLDTGNGNGIIEGSETIQLIFSILNQGSHATDSMIFRLDEADTTFGYSEIYRGIPLAPGETGNFEMLIDIPEIYNSLPATAIPIVSGDDTYFLDTVFLLTGRYSEDFSSLSAHRIPWNVLEWGIDTTEHFSAPASLRSDTITHLESASAMVMLHVFHDDSIAFRLKVSSEAGYDELRFLVNGNEQASWSGETGWLYRSFHLPPGLHEVEWRYRKDQNISEGADAAWIDNIVFPEDAFVEADLEIEEVLLSGRPPFSGSELFSIRVRSHGTEPVDSFSVRYRLNEDAWEETGIKGTINPGAAEILDMPDPINLESVGIYSLETVIGYEPDAYPLNDTLVTLIDHYAFPDLSVTFSGIDSSAEDHLDLLAMVENLGNVTTEGFSFSVGIDGTFSFNGRKEIELDPGEDSAFRVTLINAFQDWIETGWHDFRLEIESDSVNANNVLSGSVYWVITGAPSLAVPLVSLYPNPATRFLIVHMGDRGMVEGSVVVTDLTGREMVRKRIDSNPVMIETGQWLPSGGVYLVGLENRLGDRLFTGRVVYLEK